MAIPCWIPASALGKDGTVAPSERILLGGIGLGGRGTGDLNAMISQPDVQFAAVCDVRKSRREAIKNMVDSRYGTNILDEYTARTQRPLHHVRDFLDCVKTRAQPRANADVACYAHIACHAANIAIFLGRKLKYDPDQNAFIGDDEANRLRGEALRAPWRL